MSQDSGLSRNVVLGLLAAGSSLAAYYGYSRYRKRRGVQPSSTGQATDTVSMAQSPAENDKESTVAASPVAGDPVPSPKADVPQEASTPQISRTNSADTNNGEMLSLSSSFEKVSMSSLRENNDIEAASTGSKSPSENFEKLSLPSDDPVVSKDAPPSPEDQNQKETTTKPEVPPASPPSSSSSKPASQKSDVPAPTAGKTDSTPSSAPAQVPRVPVQETVSKLDSAPVQSSPRASKEPSTAPVNAEKKPEDNKPVLAMQQQQKQPQQQQQQQQQQPLITDRSEEVLSRLPPIAGLTISKDAPKEAQTAKEHSSAGLREGVQGQKSAVEAQQEQEEEDEELATDSDASGDSQIGVTRV